MNMNIYEQSDDRNLKSVSNQTLNLVIITLELNNPERKWDKVGILESAPPFEYLRNTPDHFSPKAADVEVVQREEKFMQGPKCVTENTKSHYETQ